MQNPISSAKYQVPSSLRPPKGGGGRKQRKFLLSLAGSGLPDSTMCFPTEVK